MFLAMHINNKTLYIFLYIYGKTFTKYLHGTWSLLNILTIFGIKEKSIILQCIFGYCYKYTPANYDCFCGPGSYKYIYIYI